jgi:hypothetical protein
MTPRPMPMQHPGPSPDIPSSPPPAPGQPTSDAESVLRCAEVGRQALESLATRYRLAVHWVAAGCEIPGSFWGAPEAGLVGDGLYVRDDTPLHSALHEACHAVCMDPDRRAVLHTDAGGDFAEEDAVCYLQILLSDAVPGAGRERLLRDMDAWGYTFRLGSARAWFEVDAADARAWLLDHGLIAPDGRPTWAMRGP